MGALRAKKGGGLRLSINASLKLPTQKLKLSSVAAQRGLTLTRRPKKSPYAIELRGRRGRELAAYPFEPKVLGDLPVGAMRPRSTRWSASTRRPSGWR